MDADEPTTAAEMALMEELRQLIEAADERIDDEAAQELLTDVLAALVKMRAVVDRADRIAALRQAKGLPAVSREAAGMLAALYEHAQRLRDQLEDL